MPTGTEPTGPLDVSAAIAISEKYTGENCPICGRSRQACPAPGGEACRFEIAKIEDFKDTIKRLGKDVDDWAKTAHEIFVALEAAYSGKTRCGWCGMVFEAGGLLPAHSQTCEKNPLGQRLAKLIAVAKRTFDGNGELLVAIAEAEKPLEPIT